MSRQPRRVHRLKPSLGGDVIPTSVSASVGGCKDGSLTLADGVGAGLFGQPGTAMYVRASWHSPRYRMCRGERPYHARTGAPMDRLQGRLGGGASPRTKARKRADAVRAFTWKSHYTLVTLVAGVFHDRNRPETPVHS